MVRKTTIASCFAPRLEAERRALAAACRRRGWQPLELGEETGRSAEDRKQLGALARLVGLALATPEQRQA